MAGQAGKKENKQKQKNRKFWKALILAATAFYIAINVFFLFTEEDFTFSRSDTFGLLFLSVVNFALYRLVDATLGAFYYTYLVDFLVVNLLVQVLVPFHWKFWFMYLLIPGYLVLILGMKTYEHVKTVGKADPNEPDETTKRSGKGKSNSNKKVVVHDY